MISNKCYYALKAMLELAKMEGEGPVTISEIAKTQHIPVRFLESILRQLKQAGLTDSVRGKEGGYHLSAPAKSITVGQIIELIEGPLVSISPQAHHGDKSNPNDVDAFADVWDQAQTALSGVLNGVTLAELAKKEKERLSKFIANWSI